MKCLLDAPWPLPLCTKEMNGLCFVSSWILGSAPQVIAGGPWTMQGFPYRLGGVTQFSSVAQSCPTLCGPMDCSTSGFPVHHQFPELAQTHVHRVGDTIQPSHPLSSPSPFLLLIFPSIKVFASESVLPIRWPKYWSFSFSTSPSNEYSGWFPLEWTSLISLLSKGLSRVFSNTVVLKHQLFSAPLSL